MIRARGGGTSIAWSRLPFFAARSPGEEEPLSQSAWVILSVVISVPALASGVALARSDTRRGLDGLLRAAWSRFVERVRLRFAATLLDLGHHLMLCNEERRARGIARKLDGRRRFRPWLRPRLGLEAAAIRAGARRADEVTLEIPVGSRVQEGNPGRTLALSCVVHHPPRDGQTLENSSQGDDCTLMWRVTNRPSEGYQGPSVTSDLPSLERALIAYHARPITRGGRFLDEGVHEAATPVLPGTANLGQDTPQARG